MREHDETNSSGTTAQFGAFVAQAGRRESGYEATQSWDHWGALQRRRDARRHPRRIAALIAAALLVIHRLPRRESLDRSS